MGKLPSNLLGGNFKWMGSIDECEKVKAVVDGVEHFHGKYCKATLRINSLPDIFTVCDIKLPQKHIACKHYIYILVLDDLNNGLKKMTSSQ